jgi:hypothetical protein
MVGREASAALIADNDAGTVARTLWSSKAASDLDSRMELAC